MRYKYYAPIAYCKTCGGSCCKKIPGTCLPRDISNLFPAGSLRESVVKALDSKKFAVDWYESPIPKYFIRPAIKDDHRRYSPTWGGECVFLSPDGCTLGDKKPHGCKIVRPMVGGGCKFHYKVNYHQLKQVACK